MQKLKREQARRGLSHDRAPLLAWPDKRLRTRAAPVEAITDEIRAIGTT